MTDSRRTFLKAAAGVTAGTVLGRRGWAQPGAFPKIDPKFMITPDQAWDWALSRAREVQLMRAARAGSDTRIS